MWINHWGWGIECSQLIPTDENKKYIFKGNSYVEEYKSCEAYQNSGNTIDKNTCESIIIKEDYKKNVNLMKEVKLALSLIENALTLKLIL